jgi:hypothetical protein
MHNVVTVKTFFAKNKSVESTVHETGLEVTSHEVSIENTDEGSNAESVNSKMGNIFLLAKKNVTCQSIITTITI